MGSGRVHNKPKSLSVKVSVNWPVSTLTAPWPYRAQEDMPGDHVPLGCGMCKGYYWLSLFCCEELF